MRDSIPSYNYPTGQSYPTSAGSKPTDSAKKSNRLYGEYFAKDDLYYKKDIIERTITSKITNESFETLLSCLIDEPDGCLYRGTLFDFFLHTLRGKAMVMFKSFISKLGSIEDFILQTPHMDYISIYCNQAINEDRYFTQPITELLVQKIASMPLEMRYTKFYIEDVEKYINFKTRTPDLVYNFVNEDRLIFLRNTILKIMQMFELIAHKLDTDFLSLILSRWLLIMSLQQDIQEYRLVDGMINMLINSASSGRMIQNHPIIDENKLTSVLIHILNLLKVRYVPGDSFSGFYNLSIAIAKIDRHDLCQCIERYLMEILQAIGSEKETLGQIFYNLVMTSFTANTCSLIQTFAESFKANGLYDQLFFIFNNIVIPYCVPKLKVDRAFEENISLCEFFFCGFAGIPLTFPPPLRDTFIDLLQFFYMAAKRDSKSRTKLVKYIDFLEILCHLYSEPPHARSWFDELLRYTQDIRQELYSKPSDIKVLVETARRLVWQISEEDFKNQINLMGSSTEKLHPKFKPSSKFKGIKNVGNSCYIACTMQALFATSAFRQRIIALMDETIKKQPVKGYGEKPDILKETQALLYHLDPRKEEPKVIDPRNFKESLPDQFRLANLEQDPSEFLKIYFDYLENRLKMMSDKDVVDSTFAGYLEVFLRCTACKGKKATNEKFLDLVLNFSEKQKNEDQIDMIKKIFEPERLTDFLCENCKKKTQDMQKTTIISKLPPFLMVTFNRFKFDQVGMKLSTQVKIQSQLDFRKIMNDNSLTPHLYRLYAVLVHIGPSAEHGHYYVLIKDQERPNGWYMLNDAQCWYADDLELSDLFKDDSLDTPYILFYEAISLQTSQGLRKF